MSIIRPAGVAEPALEQAAFRLFALAVALSCGVALAERVSPRAREAFLLATVGLLVAVCARRRPSVLLFAVAVVGFGVAGVRVAALDASVVARGGIARADALLEGRVLDDVALRGGAVRFTVLTNHVEIDGRPYRARSRVIVTLRPPPERAVLAGSLVRLDARLAPLGSPRDEGAERRLKRKGVSARAYVTPSGIEVTGRSIDPLSRVALVGRDAVARAARHVPARERGLFMGVTVGDTSGLDPEDELDFKATGLTHLLAVSGANVAMVLGAVTLALRGLRVGGRATVVVLAACLLSFMAITRFEPSVLRAGTMAGIALGGSAIGARRRSAVALAAATLLLLAIDPFLAFSAGFQLSVLATLGLLTLAPRLAAAFPDGKLAAATALTLGAQIAVAPILLFHFHQISVVSIAANLLAGIAVAPATIIGLVSAAAGAVWAPLAHIAILAGPPLQWMRTVARALAQFPLATVDTPSGVGGLVVATVAAVAAVKMTRGYRPRAATLTLVVLLLATGGVWARAVTPVKPPGLEVIMADVGQGDAFIVRASGRTMLIDGGGDPRVTLRVLREANVRSIDLLVLTHPHADHIDGLVPVAARLPIGRALDPYIEAPLATYRAIVTSLARRGIPRDRALAGAELALGDARVEVLWPPRDHLEGTESDTNNNAIVLRVSLGAARVLFAGELQEEGMEALLSGRDRLRLEAEVLKVSHHGSRRMLPEFYAATHATTALIPVGPNTFGHPAQETLAALEGMRVLRTDTMGTVRVHMDEIARQTVRTELRPPAA